MSVPMLIPTASGVITQMEYERRLGNDIIEYKNKGMNPVDDAVQAVKDAQYNVGRGIWEE